MLTMLVRGRGHAGRSVGGDQRPSCGSMHTKHKFRCARGCLQSLVSYVTSTSGGLFTWQILLHAVTFTFSSCLLTGVCIHKSSRRGCEHTFDAFHATQELGLSIAARTAMLPRDSSVALVICRESMGRFVARRSAAPAQHTTCFDLPPSCKLRARAAASDSSFKFSCSVTMRLMRLQTKAFVAVRLFGLCRC